MHAGEQFRRLPGHLGAAGLGLAQFPDVAVKAVNHRLGDEARALDAVHDGVSGAHGVVDGFQAHRLGLVDLGHGLGQLHELPVQGVVRRETNSPTIWCRPSTWVWVSAMMKAFMFCPMGAKARSMAMPMPLSSLWLMSPKAPFKNRAWSS